MTWGRNWIECQCVFAPRDLSVGLHWSRYPKAIEIYLCPLPMVQIRWYWQWDK